LSINVTGSDGERESINSSADGASDGPSEGALLDGVDDVATDGETVWKFDGLMLHSNGVVAVDGGIDGRVSAAVGSVDDDGMNKRALLGLKLESGSPSSDGVSLWTFNGIKLESSMVGMTVDGCMDGGVVVEGASIDGVVVGTKEGLGEVLDGKFVVGASRWHRGNPSPSTEMVALEPPPL
jgi:hypothetical protein